MPEGYLRLIEKLFIFFDGTWQHLSNIYKENELNQDGENLLFFKSMMASVKSTRQI